MPRYRVYLLDTKEHVLTARDVVCADDGEAVRIARAWLLAHDAWHDAFMLWEKARQVACEDRATAASRGAAAAAEWAAPPKKP